MHTSQRPASQLSQLTGPSMTTRLTDPTLHFSHFVYLLCPRHCTRARGVALTEVTACRVTWGGGNGMSVTLYPPAANTAVTNSGQEKLQCDRDRKQEPLTRRTLSEKDRKFNSYLYALCSYAL